MTTTTSHSSAPPAYLPEEHPRGADTIMNTLENLCADGAHTRIAVWDTDPASSGNSALAEIVAYSGERFTVIVWRHRS